MAAFPEFSVVEMIDGSPVAGREEIDSGSAQPLKFFRLQQNPFADSVNPEFFYRTEAHEAAFIAMKRCIEEDISLGLTTAASGTGKTLLTQVLLHELDPERYKPALILIYPKMSRMAMLREICAELQIEIRAKRPTTHDLMETIQRKIMDLAVEGVKLVVIIDEVHFLTAENLQVLRTLSNIEVPEKKLVTVLLFGEESLLPRLDDPKFKSILSRMYTRVHLRALTPDEVEQYVKYRLLLAHGRPDIFQPDCFAWLARETGGIPREINRVCYNAMREAAAHRQSRVTPDLLGRMKEEG
ncbi:AAA family ATPase [Candidatus Sumerlaeota bacterium]|nr:AAA family ATPase [Candidatus Sumerlaeota bacterium]